MHDRPKESHSYKTISANKWSTVYTGAKLLETLKDQSSGAAFGGNREVGREREQVVDRKSGDCEREGRRAEKYLFPKWCTYRDMRTLIARALRGATVNAVPG